MCGCSQTHFSAFRNRSLASRMSNSSCVACWCLFLSLDAICSGWLWLHYTWTKVKKILVNVVDGLPSTTWRQVTCNASNNNGDGALTIVPLCRELSGSRDHTREAMEVKRTSWANYGRYRRSYILLVSTWWLMLESYTMTQRVMQPVLLLAFLLWWVIRTHH